MEAYVKRCVALLSQAPYRFNTFYLGGGTPSLLSPALLLRVLAAARPKFLPNAEVTMECNPSTVTPALCCAMAAGGVNRVSLGLQSVLPGERRALGRAATPALATQALATLRAAGIPNISLDVMLGVPHQTLQSLEETLAFCVAEKASHISAYLLALEPNTPFGRKAPPALPDEDAQAALYLHCCAWLKRRGYLQYEISNFGLPNFESRHNLAYWHCLEYYAVGPSAHGYTQGRRWHYPRNLEDFLQGAAPVDDGPGGSFEERAMLALRLTEGLPNPPAAMRQRGAPYVKTGHLVADQHRLRLTPKGFLLSNYLIGQLLSAGHI
jgi:oxygen-independent coproporphyrinogen-3 oxidase